MSASTLPAYGRGIIDARRRGASVNLFIYAGTRCWPMAQAREHAVAVPTPEDARHIDWRPIAGGLSGVTLVARGWPDAEVERLARSLILAGAKMVCAVHVLAEGDRPTITSRIFRRKVKEAAR